MLMAEKILRAMKVREITCWLSFYLLVLIFAAAPASGQELINCLVASVDNQPVTLFDLRVAKTFNLLGGSSGESISAEDILNRYIDMLLVLRLAREQISLAPEEIKAELEKVKERTGSEAFEVRCRELGLKPEDLSSYLQDKILFEKVIGIRFSQRLYVSLKEIEDYYQKIYVPEQKAAGREPAGLVDVLNEIESRLQARRQEERVREWTQELRQRAEIIIYSECLKRL